MLEIEKYNKIIIANWKLNGSSSFIQSFLKNVKLEDKYKKPNLVIICPPFPYINQITSNKIAIGSQDCSMYVQGSYTGETSAKMLKNIGCGFCIIGHSERRNLFNESNQIIFEKVTRCFEEDIIPVLCIGESLLQKKNKETKEVLINQIDKCIPKKENKKNIIIAYEPVWAIGSGLTPTLQDIDEIHKLIKERIPKTYNYKVLYGGSVKPSNSKEIMALKCVDGVLVGGASIDIDEFNKIINFNISLD
jgi:triosephosphate isomerase